MPPHGIKCADMTDKPSHLTCGEHANEYQSLQVLAVYVGFHKCTELLPHAILR
jgi:hypothetical protein